MAINPIVLNGTIQQTHDVLQNQTRQVEKGMVDQGHILSQEVKKEEQRARQVVNQENATFMQERYDAKEKGHGSYQGDGGKKRRDSRADGRVVAKPEGGFDMKI